MAFVEVAVNAQDRTIRQTFSYTVLEGITLSRGDAVLVPFGRRQLQGIVMTSWTPAFSDPAGRRASAASRWFRRNGSR
jgi:primosomal protein N'